MKKVIFIVLCLLLAACGNKDQQGINDTSRVLAQMGDFKLTEAYLQTYLKNSGISEPDNQQLNTAMDEIIAQQALAQQASKAGLNLSLEQLYTFQQFKERALAQLAVEKYLADYPVADAELQAEYERITAELQGQEYQVHHMLFKDEVQALTMLEEIKAGAVYTELEADYMLTHANVKNVGNIGWVNIMQVPEAFRGPLRQMQAGQVHDRVVNSQFGAHVLYLEGKRAIQPPAFEAVKEGIRKTLEQQKIDRYKQLAVVKAKVKLEP